MLKSVIVVLTVSTVVISTVSLAFFYDSEKPSTTPTPGPRAVDTLKFMIIVSRHGNRGSSYDYPGDPYPIGNKMYWPYGPAGLTHRGRTQVYNLGQRVRSLYSGFIPDLYSTDDIISRSTYLDRIVMSGQGFLAGLYPPKGFQVWNSDLAWQPTVIYSDSPDNSVVITDGNCNYYETYFKQIVSEENTKFADHQRYLKEYIHNVTGENTTTLSEFMLWDKLSCETIEGYEIPDWANVIYPNSLWAYVLEEYTRLWGGTDQIVRLVVGEMYEQMLNAMIQKVNGTLTPDRKILYYSGHDTSIIGLQRILGVPPQSMEGMVRPASALIIELHQNPTTNKYYLQAMYLNGADLIEEPRNLNMTSDLDDLINDSQRFLHVNYVEECK